MMALPALISTNRYIFPRKKKIPLLKKRGKNNFAVRRLDSLSQQKRLIPFTGKYPIDTSSVHTVMRELHWPNSAFQKVLFSA